MITYSIWAYDRVVTEEPDGSLYSTLDYRELTQKDFRVINNTTIELTIDVELMVEVDGEREYFLIEKGFLFDGATIPEAFWKVIGKPTSKKFRIPSLIHDVLYINLFNRKAADDLFHHMLVKEGVWTLKAETMWAAVRVGGGQDYKDEPGVVKKFLKLFKWF